MADYMNNPSLASVVPATLNDLEDIRDLATLIWNIHYPGIITQAQIDYMLERDYSTDQLRLELSSGVMIDKLMLQDKMEGFAAYGQHEDPATIKLHKIYIHPDRHQLGLGSLMLSHVEQRSIHLGFKRIILQVNKSNHKAIRSYTRNGYHEHESVTVDIGEGFVMDDYIMAKELSASE
jgi:GNAT superfamily N-acetyltransferase